MQTSGFFTRSVASFAISRNLRRARGARGQALGFAPLQTEELLPVAALLVHLAQVLDRLRVVGIDREDRLVRLHRLGLVRELGDVEVGGLRVERDLLVGVGDEPGELEQRLDVLVVALRRLLLVGERAELGDLRFVGVSLDGGAAAGARPRRDAGAARQARSGRAERQRAREPAEPRGDGRGRLVAIGSERGGVGASDGGHRTSTCGRGAGDRRRHAVVERASARGFSVSPICASNARSCGCSGDTR